MTEYKTITQKVEYCLSKHPDTRNSDRLLMVTLWQTFFSHKLDMARMHLDPIAALLDIFVTDLPSPESIRRVRQKLQEGGRYQADDAIRATRMTKARKVQDGVMGRSPKKSKHWSDEL